MSIYRLSCHPQSLNPPAIDISVTLLAVADASLVLRYHLQGDLTQLIIPAAQTPAVVDGLWEHTCFEAFLAEANTPEYYEYNFSPSGQWAAYAFSAYRQRQDWSPRRPPNIECRQNTNELIMDVVCVLPSAPQAQQQPLGLSAVIETLDGERSYWALRHPGTHADFHDRGGFSAFYQPLS